MSENDTVLGNRTRKLIYNHILSYPGISYSKLRSIFDIPESTLRYHLRYLERKKEIDSSVVNGRRYFNPTEHAILLDDKSGFGKLTTTQVKALNAIKRHPGITQKELVERTGKKRITITNCVKKLIKLQMVRKVRDGRNVHYYHVTEEEVREALLRKLVIKLVNREIDEKRFLVLKNFIEKEK
jgi:predicted transcriptional regulator